MKAFLKEPLCHFILIGAAFFGMYAAVNPESGSDKRIVVDEGRVNNLIAVFEETWNRAPTDAEVDGLINEFVLEEIYYREALAMGIDKNDATIRSLLSQKMEFFANAANAANAVVEPETAELEQYLHDNQAKYKTGNRYSFDHIYISPDGDQAKLNSKIAQIQAALDKDEQVQGDQTFLPSSFTNASAIELDRVLGSGFAAQLDGLELNQWSEPLRSGLGTHFVKLSAVKAGELPVLSAVRDKVMQDWMYERAETLRSKTEQQLLEKYEVIVTGVDNRTDRDGGA